MSSPAPSSSASPIPKKRRLWPWAMALALLAAGGWYASQRGEPPGGEGNGHGNGKSAAGRPGGPGGRGDRPTPVTLATIGTADPRHAKITVLGYDGGRTSPEGSAHVHMSWSALCPA